MTIVNTSFISGNWRDMLWISDFVLVMLKLQSF